MDKNPEIARCPCGRKPKVKKYMNGYHTRIFCVHQATGVKRADAIARWNKQALQSLAIRSGS